MAVVSALLALFAITGAAVVGFVAGRGRRAKAPTGPICGCTHNYGSHDPKHGECYGEIRRRRYDAIGNRSGYTWVGCRCVRYDGPEPLGTVWVPPLPGG